METVRIYCLLTPENKVFYIGQTTKPVMRYASHIERFGAHIQFEFLDEVPYKLRYYWEQFYIDLYRAWGFVLENKDTWSKLHPFYHSYEQCLNRKTKIEKKENKTIASLERNSIKQQATILELRRELKKETVLRKYLEINQRQKKILFKDISDLDKINEVIKIKLRKLLSKEFTKHLSYHYPKHAKSKWVKESIKKWNPYTLKAYKETLNYKSQLSNKNTNNQMDLFK